MPRGRRITRSAARQNITGDQDQSDEEDQKNVTTTPSKTPITVDDGEATRNPPIGHQSNNPVANSPPMVTQHQFQELLELTRQLQARVDLAMEHQERGDSSTATSTAQDWHSRQPPPKISGKRPFQTLEESDQEDEEVKKRQQKKKKGEKRTRLREELQQLRALILRKDVEPISWNRDGLTPFRATLIQDAKKFKPPAMDVLNGAEDPRNHIRKFDQIMRLSGASEAQKCLAFSATLSGDASTLYNGLPSGVFASFNQFAETFVTNFAAFMFNRKHANRLAGITQTKDETLREYSIRFEKEGLSRAPTKDNAIETYTQGLYYPEFRGMMLRDPPKTWNALMARASKEMAVDEDQRKRVKLQQSQRNSNLAQKKKEIAALEASGSKKAAEVPQEVIKVDKKQNPRSESRPDFSQKSYTPLKAPLSQILREIRSMPNSEEILPEPRPITNVGSRKDEYCEYHKIYGHRTDYCWGLKNSVERKISEGHLKRYIDTRKVAA